MTKPRTLTTDEVALVRRWARKQRIVIMILAPLMVPMGAIAVVLGVASLFDTNPDVFTCLAVAACGGIVIAFPVMMWRSGKRYGAVDETTQVSELRGVFRVRYDGKTHSYAIGDTYVMLATGEFRRQLIDGKPCVVDVIWEAPILVVCVKSPAPHQTHKS